MDPIFFIAICQHELNEFMFSNLDFTGISDSQLAEKSNPCYENLGMSIESEFSSFTKDAG